MFRLAVQNIDGITDNEGMSYLQTPVSMLARKTISGFLCRPSFYESALPELDRSLGYPHTISLLK